MSVLPTSNDDGIGIYWAVLVGVGEYDDRNYSSLPVCAKDVKAVAKQLTHNGYGINHMRLLVDENLLDDDPLIQQLAGNVKVSKPMLGNVLTALKRVAATAKPEDLLLFYYTGHGGQQDDEGLCCKNKAHQIR